MVRRALPIALASLTVALGTGTVGCGSEAQSFDDVVRGLKSAAVSKQTFNAIRHADDLEATEKAVVNALCQVTNELLANGLGAGEDEYFARIESSAEQSLGSFASTPVDGVVRRLRGILGAASINGGVANAYVRACYR